MKNKMKKCLALCLASVTAFSALAFTGCDDGSTSSNQSVLKIRYYNGGLGEAWIKEVEKDFESMFANVSFEDGKQGVDVQITPDKQFTDIEQTVAIGADKNDIYYTPDTDAFAHVSAGVTMDVTNIYTEKVYDANGSVKLTADGKGFEIQTQSLRDRANDDVKETYNFGTETEPLYYGIPYADCLSGFVVDYDLFEEEGWNNYEGLNGLPATVDDFYDLLQRMQRGGYSGFSYSVAHYTPQIVWSIIQKVDGTAGMDLWNSYKGEYDFNADGTISDDEKITLETAYKLLDTRGYQAAYEFVSTMFTKDANGNAYYDPNVVQGVSYSGCQQDFLMSKTSSNRSRIAMIIEGEWWENEARGTFTSMGNLNAEDGYGKRDFRFMPIPQFTENDKEEKYTIGSHSGLGELLFVNAKEVKGNAVKEKLAKLWLQYQYSTECLKVFTKNAGSVLPYKYEMTPTELADVTPFVRSVWEMHTSEQVEIVRYCAATKTDDVRLAPIVLEFDSRVNGVAYNGGALFTNMLKMAQRGDKISFADWLAGAHDYYDNSIAQAFGK